MADQKPIVLSAEDANRLGMLQTRMLLANKTIEDLLARRTRDSVEATEILAKYGLAETRGFMIATEPGDPHPVGTAFNPETGAVLLK